MLNYKSLLVLLVSVFLLNKGTLAQDTMRIDVIKPFIATLSDAMKIQSNPNPETPQIKRDSFTYSTQEIAKEDLPTVYTIKPLSLGTSLLPKLRNNYIKLGFGNYGTPLAELYLNTTRNRNLQAGVYLKHLSSHPADRRSFSNNSVLAYGKKFVTGGIIEGDIAYNRNLVHLYGLDFNGSKALSGAYPAPANANIFELFELKGGYSNILKDTSKLGYKLNARYYHLSAPKSLTENDFLLSATFNKSVQGNPLNVYTAIQTNQNDSGSNSYKRVFVDVNPTYRLNMDRSYIMLGFNSTFFNDTNGTKFHFFPKAEIGYKIIPNALTVYGGIRGDLKRHTLRSISNENPFIRRVNFENTLNQFELYAGLKGIISAQTSFMLEASLSSVKNLMFYVADSGLYNQRAIYDNSTSSLTRIKAELNHEFGEQFRFGFVMNYYNYSLSINAPYSLPTFTTSVNLLYNMGNKFFIRSELYTMNQRVTQLVSATDKKDITLSGLVDVNLGIDYRYNRNVKIFLNLNNLTNNQYQRWLNLPVFGFNVLGGLGITF